MLRLTSKRPFSGMPITSVRILRVISRLRVSAATFEACLKFHGDTLDRVENPVSLRNENEIIRKAIATL